MTTITSTPPREGRPALADDAARRMYDAEVALHIARQAGVTAWISAAYDRLHEAIANHTAALTADTAPPAAA
jgi:hypothetical protein